MIYGKISPPLVDIEMDENKRKFQILFLNLYRTAMLGAYQVQFSNNSRGGDFNKSMIMNGTPKLGADERMALYMHKLRYAISGIFGTSDMLLLYACYVCQSLCGFN